MVEDLMKDIRDGIEVYKGSGQFWQAMTEKHKQMDRTLAALYIYIYIGNGQLAAAGGTLKLNIGTVYILYSCYHFYLTIEHHF